MEKLNELFPKKEGKELKLWNGGGHGRYQNNTLYVAAYSQKQCAEMVSAVCFGGRTTNISTHEIKNYYNVGRWGTAMDGVIPKEPQVWVREDYNLKPERIL